MPVENLTLIAKKYLSNDFLLDLIPIIPITLIFFPHNEYIRLFYLVKVTRI